MLTRQALACLLIAGSVLAAGQSAALASRQDAASGPSSAIGARSSIHALAHGSPFSAALQPAMLLDGRLRSAWLLKLRGEETDVAGASPETVRAQLQAHFVVVEQILWANSQRSLNVALARLEAARGRPFTSVERLLVREHLAAQRARQIARLAEYRQRGRFPLYESYPGRALPIFVDNHDTACAVGYLMRQSGWQEAVAEVQASNNLVYVPQVSSGPVRDWVLQSGLTQEEAALVQPGYPFPRGVTAESILQSGGQIESAGLRMENFTFEATGDGGLTADDIFIAIFSGDDPSKRPEPGSHGVNITSVPTLFSNDRFRVEAGQSTTIRFGYDLFAVDPQHQVDLAFIYGGNGLNYYNEIDPGGSLKLVMTVSDGIQPIDTLEAITTDLGGPIETPSTSFGPLQGIHVDSELTLDNGVWFDSVVQGYDFGFVVPEPSSAILGVLGASMTLLFALRRRGKSIC